MRTEERRTRIREVRARLGRDGPAWTRGPERDFETVTLPERDCDLLRDLLISEGVGTVVEVGLAYGSSALAIGEALVTVDPPHPRHVVIDPFQQRAFANVGWDLLRSAGLDSIASLMVTPPRSRSRNLSPRVSSPTRPSWTAATGSTRSSSISTSSARSSGRAADRC